jgi:hypothetical protein
MLNYIRDDIYLNIKSNIPLPIPFDKNRDYIEINYHNDTIELITPNGRKTTFEEVVLLFLYLINLSSREQIGVVIPKTIPKTLDNQLTYLIIKRKDEAEYSDIYFLVYDKKILFPFFSTKENRVFNILKLAELIKRRDLDIDEFLDKITQKKG